jgi:hypothetical protein
MKTIEELKCAEPTPFTQVIEYLRNENQLLAKIIAEKEQRIAEKEQRISDLFFTVFFACYFLLILILILNLILGE